MPRDVVLEHGQPFNDAISLIRIEVDRWFSPGQTLLPSLDGFDDLISLQDHRRVWLYGNARYHEHYADRTPATDPNSEILLGSAVNQLARKTDDLILSGCESLMYEHVDTGADGRAYMMKTYKEMIRTNALGASILSICRPLIRLGRQQSVDRESLESIASLFQSLDRVDQELCRRIAMGESSRQIAARLDCATRTVENHRAKIMAKLHLEKPIDIVKLMVRLADQGLIRFSV